MIWFVDAHVHYHDCFGWRRFLNGALENLDRLAAAEPADAAVTGCLFFVDPEGRSSPALLASAAAESDDRSLPAGCSLVPLRENGAVRLERGDLPALLLVGGRQVATREGLEVLALSNRTGIADGLPLDRSVEASLAGAELTVLPWGFGKWWGARGRLVERVFAEARHERVYLGDNGNRAALAAEPEVFAESRRRGVPILTGSDPLPFAHHARRALGYGFRLEGEFDPAAPGSSVRRTLDAMDSSPAVFGRRSSVPHFLGDQLRMQWQVRVSRSRSAGDAGGQSR